MCIYIYIYTHIYVHTHIWELDIYTQFHSLTYIQTHTHMLISVSEYIFVYEGVRECIYMCVCVCERERKLESIYVSAGMY